MTPQLNPQFAARALAAQGRGDDTELVHMSPKEVASLQSLAQQHGIASLTRNPSTGLVEAGALSAILPAVAGAALMTFAPELAPVIGDAAAGFLGSGVGAAVTVGGVDALATGSMKQGLMAGLGAYGGATMAGAGGANIFGSAGASTATNTASIMNDATAAQGAAGEQGVQGATTAQDMSQINSAMGNTGVPAAASSATAAAAPQGIAAIPSSGAPDMSQINSVMGNPAASGAAATGMGTTPQLTMEQQLAANSAQGPFQTANYNRLFNTAAMAAPALGATQTAAPPTALQNLENTVHPYTFKETQNNAPGMAGNAASPYFTQQFTALPTYVAGQQASTMPTANLAGGGLAKGPPKGDNLRSTLSQLHGVEHLTHFADGGNTGGISSLGSYSDGGRLLRGPGDGVSDSIPASIGQHQPARLAEGEFVVPARIVSELGNGSTNAGAKRLYAMLDRIQAGRSKTVGKGTEYAKDTNPSKHLPA